MSDKPKKRKNREEAKEKLENIQLAMSQLSKKMRKIEEQLDTANDGDESGRLSGRRFDSRIG